MIKAVLDTNILLSSLFWKGQPRKIVDLAIENKFRAITSADILEEVKRVGDKDLLVLKKYARIKITTAREFLEILKH